jgi:hypothetical protein
VPVPEQDTPLEHLSEGGQRDYKVLDFDDGGYLGHALLSFSGEVEVVGNRRIVV